MPASLEDVEALYQAVSELRRERMKMEKLSQKARSAETPKKIQKANADLNYQAFHVVLLEHRAHAAAVDCGIADLRKPERYDPYPANINGWHKYVVTPDRPRDLPAANS